MRGRQRRCVPSRQHPRARLLPLSRGQRRRDRRSARTLDALPQHAGEEEPHMLTHPTQERLTALGLTGMAKALEEQRRQPDVAALAFEERLAMLVDREAIERENKRLVSR